MQSILLVLHVLVAVALIGIILIQHGKGADAGAAFGSGASATVFGARGSGSFLTRTTTILAVVFLANSLFLAYLSGQSIEKRGLMERVQDAGLQQQKQKPAPTGGDDLPEIPATEVPADTPPIPVQP